MKRFLFVVLISFASVGQIYAAEIQKQVLEHGTFNYLFPADKIYPGFGPTTYSDYCGNTIPPKKMVECSCESNVVYPILKGAGSFTEINKKLKQIADGYKCSPNSGETFLKYEVTLHKENISSFIFNEYNAVPLAGGGCNGNTETMTVNTQTDHIYTLDEVLDRSRESEIRAYIISYFMAPAFTQDIRSDAMVYNDWKSSVETAFDHGYIHDEAIHADVKKPKTVRFWTLGFYIKNGQLFVDLDYYLGACAGGTSYPVPIPPKFVINKDIAALLKKY